MGQCSRGQSTLLNMLGTLDVPTEGMVLISGIDLRRFGGGGMRTCRLAATTRRSGAPLGNSLRGDAWRREPVLYYRMRPRQRAAGPPSGRPHLADRRRPPTRTPEGYRPHVFAGLVPDAMPNVAVSMTLCPHSPRRLCFGSSPPPRRLDGLPRSTCRSGALTWCR
jgi:hypothetical protein